MIQTLTLQTGSNYALTGPLQKSLLDKLHALTDLDEMAETLHQQIVATNLPVRFVVDKTVLYLC